MHLQIDRQPPPIEEVVQRMKARIDRDRLTSETDRIRSRAVSSKTRERSERSLPHCHLPAEPKKPRHPPPRDTGAYVPEMSARIENDRNLTDGARRCARKVAEYVYRKNRAGRASRDHRHLADEGARPVPPDCAALSAPVGARRLHRSSCRVFRAHPHVLRAVSSASGPPVATAPAAQMAGEGRKTDAPTDVTDQYTKI